MLLFKAFGVQRDDKKGANGKEQDHRRGRKVQVVHNLEAHRNQMPSEKDRNN